MNHSRRRPFGSGSILFIVCVLNRIDFSTRLHGSDSELSGGSASQFSHLLVR